MEGAPAKITELLKLDSVRRVGEDDTGAVWGGVHLYFVRADKSAIDRHREDDPDMSEGGDNATRLVWRSARLLE
jgi:hypothetical protein